MGKSCNGLDKQTNARKCRDIIKLLMMRPSSSPFNQPVDPAALNIPDYFKIIQRPMDLRTIKENLRVNIYINMLDFAQDLRLTFENAMLFNPVKHPVHQLAMQLLNEVNKILFDLVQERSDDVVSEEQVDDMLNKYPLADPIEFAPLIMPAPSAGRGKDIALVSIMANRRNESAALSAARIASHVQHQRQAQAAL